MKIKKFQMGGPAPVAAEDPAAVQGAPVAPETAPQGGEDPLMQIAQMMMQGLETQDCNMLAEACTAFLQLLQGAQGGGEPVFKKGGKLVKRTKKTCGR